MYLTELTVTLWQKDNRMQTKSLSTFKTQRNPLWQFPEYPLNQFSATSGTKRTQSQFAYPEKYYATRTDPNSLPTHGRRWCLVRASKWRRSASSQWQCSILTRVRLCHVFLSPISARILCACCRCHVKYFTPFNSSRLGHVGKIIN